MKAGFVNIFGRPNAGKSTLLNALLGEKLAIVSHKVQTTRHRIKGIISNEDHQIIVSDTPGIIDPQYKLHERMMQAVKSALEDADLALLLVDPNEDPKLSDEIFTALRLRVPAFVLLNKTDSVRASRLVEAETFFTGRPYCKKILHISAAKGTGIPELMKEIIGFLPEGEPFYPDDEISDLPTRFFVAELIREQIYELFSDEIPYHSTVIVNEFSQKSTLIKIRAEIIVQRESQKGIILGEKGKMIRAIGTEARKAIEEFVGQKVFLELFVKVRSKWRENDLFLKEYGY